mmetsp:Transcript_36881/g.101484  ORF Transcript_36881/g.101484 Transcript_36881/m.101484 type:complete len:294 (+) Transcript_36881:786-1667(+)
MACSTRPRPRCNSGPMSWRALRRLGLPPRLFRACPSLGLSSRASSSSNRTSTCCGSLPGGSPVPLPVPTASPTRRTSPTPAATTCTRGSLKSTAQSTRSPAIRAWTTASYTAWIDSRPAHCSARKRTMAYMLRGSSLRRAECRRPTFACVMGRSRGRRASACLCAPRACGAWSRPTGRRRVRSCAVFTISSVPTARTSASLSLTCSRAECTRFVRTSAPSGIPSSATRPTGGSRVLGVRGSSSTRAVWASTLETGRSTCASRCQLISGRRSPPSRRLTTGRWRRCRGSRQMTN